MELIETLRKAGIIPVIVIEDAEQAVSLARALVKGGLPVLEVTFRTAAAADAIARIKVAVPEAVVGAGTLLAPAMVKAAKAAGADFVGLADLIEKVTKEGWCDFDVAIATVEAMKEVRKCARILGPRGLMPNPKTGTVTDDTATAVKEAKGGKVDFRMDKTGNLAVVAGKRSFEADKLVQNIKAVVAAVNAAKPASVKGVFIKSMTIATTMGVGVPVIATADAE